MSKNPRVLVFTALIIIAIGGAVWYFSPQANEVLNQSSNTEGWLTYTNIEYGFQFKYPPSYSVTVPSRNFGNGEVQIFRVAWPEVQYESNQNLGMQSPMGIDVGVYTQENLQYQRLQNCDHQGDGLSYGGWIAVAGLRFCQGFAGDVSAEVNRYAIASKDKSRFVYISFWNNTSIKMDNNIQSNISPKAVLATFKFTQ